MIRRAASGASGRAPGYPGARAAVAVLLVAAGVARAEPGAASGVPALAPAATATSYPVRASVVVTADALAAEYRHDPLLDGAPNPSCAVAVGVQARDAWAAAARRLFGGAPGAAAVAIEVSIPEAAVERSAGEWRARVVHDVVLREEGAGEIARWKVAGEGRIDGLDAQWVRAAFARAAESATAAFERELDASAAVRTWLAGRGLPRRVVPAALPPAARPRPVFRERGRFVAFLDAGPSRSSGAEGSVMGVGVRLGLSGRWLLAQATLDGWTPPFTPAPSFGQPSSGHLEMLVAGVDLGGVLRLPRRFELRGGAGWRLVRATASMGYAIATPIGGGVASEMTITHSRSVASVFGSVLYAPAEERWHLRGRVGLEIRRDLGGAIRFDAFGRDVAPGTAVLLLLGGELRLGPARTVATSGP